MALSKRNYYVLGNGIKNREETGNVWGKLLRLGTPCNCSKCNSEELSYDGLGRYICTACGTEHLDNYGKVRSCIEENGFYSSMPVQEVMARTGLNKTEIMDLLDAGKIHRASYGIIC